MAGNPAPILFVDVDSFERMHRPLEVAGYVVAACSIETVRDTVAMLRPLVIVLDAQLLVGAHAGVLENLKLGATGDLPIILTSKVKQEKLGPDYQQYEVFSRPINREKLLRAIYLYDIKASGEVERAV